MLAPAGHKILVHVSNFRPVKRIPDVIRIFSGVRRAMPATLILVGDGPDRDAAEKEADRLQLGSDVRFLGKVDQVAEVLRGSDLLLLPSQTESFGLAALEAMACGVPVVNTNLRSGVPFVSVDGETGLTVEPRDSVGLGDAIAQLLANPEERRRLGEAARARVENLFHVDVMTRDTFRVYEEVLDGD
jgi:N-acetyl-alpha-D-glucosaminyl L-malate synthase BshA